MRRQYTFDTGPKMYHLEIGFAHPNVLTAGSPGRVRRLAEYLEGAEIIESDRGLVTVHGLYYGMPVTAFSSGMGTGSVSCTLPEVIEACDEDGMSIIRLGTAGGLQKYLNIGDFVVTTEVQRAETTSDKIMHPGYVAVASPQAVATLEQTAGIVKAPFQQVYVGRSRVTDDIYFDALASKQKDHGDVLAVSMEASAIFALRDRYNQDQGRSILAGELLVVSDNVVAEAPHIDMGEFLARQKLIEEAHVRAGLESLLKLRMV